HIFRCKLQCFDAIPGGEDAETGGFQEAGSEFTNSGVVLGNENRERLRKDRDRNEFGSGGFGFFLHLRQIDLKTTAPHGSGLHPDKAAALLDDSIDGGKSQACAFAYVLCRKERLEDASLRLGVHAMAGI